MKKYYVINVKSRELNLVTYCQQSLTGSMKLYMLDICKT